MNLLADLMAAPSAGLVLITGLIVAGVVKGATGIGYASCALPFLVTTIGLRPAMAVVLAPALATNAAVAISAGQLRATVRAFWPLYAAMLPGVAVGVTALVHVDPRLAIQVLSFTIVAYALHTLLRPTVTLPAVAVRVLRAPVGFVNGAVAGLTGSQVMPLLPFVMALPLKPDETVQAINLGVLVASLALAAMLSASGAIEPGWLALSLLAILPALLGAELGRRLRAHLSEHHFRKAVLLVLIASGVVMAVRSVAP